MRASSAVGATRRSALAARSLEPSSPMRLAGMASVWRVPSRPTGSRRMTAVRICSELLPAPAAPDPGIPSSYRNGPSPARRARLGERTYHAHLLRSTSIVSALRVALRSRDERDRRFFGYLDGGERQRGRRAGAPPAFRGRQTSATSCSFFSSLQRRWRSGPVMISTRPLIAFPSTYEYN